MYASSASVESDDLGRYNALFGRDSLITSLQVLPARPDVARATLRTLAGLIGRFDNPQTDEEPGKVIHEWWPRAGVEVFRRLGWSPTEGELRHYGSADASGWFLVVLASLDDSALADELEPAWRGAGEWLERALSRGGGLVRHGPRLAPAGLAQQGWRDATAGAIATGHGIARADGGTPRPPLADADCQAVAVVAARALAALSGEHRHASMADELAERVAAFFGPETMALESDGTPVRGAGSQLGWLLWSGALGDEATGRVAQRLCEPDVLTGFGLRTLSRLHPAFGPAFYHRGAVWPFDSWLGWGGLRAAGRDIEAERVRTGVLEALDRLGHAPELYAVGAGGPERIPVANLVQAWTIGARWALGERWDGRAPELFGATPPPQELSPDAAVATPGEREGERDGSGQTPA